MRVDNSARSGGIIRISLIFYNMKVYCVLTLESPHRGDSNEYTQYTIFQYEKEKHPKLSQICSYGNFSKGLKNEFERAVVNEPSVFEPLKFYCNLFLTVLRRFFYCGYLLLFVFVVRDFTAELQWREHLRHYEDVFETGLFRANEY